MWTLQQASSLYCILSDMQQVQIFGEKILISKELRYYQSTATVQSLLATSVWFCVFLYADVSS
jgi:hypothetical protein